VIATCKHTGGIVLIRSLLAGLVLALLMACSMANGLMQWLIGSNESYMFGSVVDSLAPAVLSATGLESLAQPVVGALLMGDLAAAGAVAWPIAEKAVVGLAGVFAKLRRNMP
jgi:hypothetical protein